MAHPSETIGVLIIVAAAAISLVLTAMAARAWQRTRNRKLLFVAAAFFVFFLKGLVTAYSIRTGFIGHEDLELLGTMMDLSVVFLLVVPFLVRHG